jgi:hypothetical protein
MVETAVGLPAAKHKTSQSHSFPEDTISGTTKRETKAMKDDTITDPKENPVSGGHLPVSGEIGGPVKYHDPTTTDTDDD